MSRHLDWFVFFDTACPLDLKLWAEICKIVLKLKDANQVKSEQGTDWLDWLSVCLISESVSQSVSSLLAKVAKLKQRSVEIETDCSQLHIHTVT